MRRKRLKQAAIFWILYCAYVSAYMARLNLSVAKPTLERLGRLDTVQLAFLGSTFSLAYAAGKLVNGRIGDRIRAGVMISAGLFLTGAGNIVMGFLPPYEVMVLCWGLNAFGQSMLWGPILNVISAVYSGQEAGKKATVIGTSIAVGNILGILAASLLINEFGPKETFMVPGIFAVALIPAVASVGGRCERTGKKTAGFSLLRRKEIWTMILAALAQGAIKDNVALFMVDYCLYNGVKTLALRRNL